MLMCGTLGYYKRRNFHRQTVSQFLVFSAKVYMSAKFFKICHPQKFMPVKFFKIGHQRDLKCLQNFKYISKCVVNYSSYIKILESQV